MKSKRISGLLTCASAAFLIVLLGNCGLHRKSHPPKATRAPAGQVNAAMEDEEVIAGMNRSEVLEAWGEPDTARAIAPDSDVELWIYVRTRANRVVVGGQARVVTTKEVWELRYRGDIVAEVIKR